MDSFSTFLYVTDLALAMDEFSSHVIMKCVTIYSTLIDNLYPLNAYAKNP